MATTTGQLRQRVAFEVAARVDDPGGGITSEWTESFRAAAEILFLKGGEDVIGQRLNGVQPSVITVRDCAAVRGVSPTWRIRDVRTGQRFNIRSVRPNERRTYIDFLCETGRPDGDETDRVGAA